MASDILRQLCMGLPRKPKLSTQVTRNNVEVCTNTKELPAAKLRGKPEKVQNRLRDHYGVSFWGDDVPELLTSFDSLRSRYGFAEQLLNNVAAVGYLKPTPVQMAVIPAFLEKREILACAPTGSGKTASFLIPIIHLLGSPLVNGFRAVIVCPTRELAKQTHREAMHLAEGTGLRVYALTKLSNAVQRFSKEQATGLDIMVTTPRRLVWLLKETDLSLEKVEYLIIDESDRLFEPSKNDGFREQLLSIYTACRSNRLRRAFFSATSTKDLDRWCRLHLDSPIIIAIGAKNSVTKQVNQKLVFVGSRSGKLFELRRLIRCGTRPPILVFVQSRTGAEKLHEHLALDGYKVDSLHGGRTDSERDRIIDNFRLGNIFILICRYLCGVIVFLERIQITLGNKISCKRVDVNKEFQY